MTSKTLKFIQWRENNLFRLQYLITNKTKIKSFETLHNGLVHFTEFIFIKIEYKNNCRNKGGNTETPTEFKHFIMYHSEYLCGLIYNLMKSDSETS